jgi:hypothetical protein
MAQSTATNSVTTPGQHHGANGDERRERMEHLLKALDLKPADLKGLSREARQTKIKETAQTVVTELQAKQTAGTLTPEGHKRLDFIQKYLANAGHKKPATTAEN